MKLSTETNSIQQYEKHTAEGSGFSTVKIPLPIPEVPIQKKNMGEVSNQFTATFKTENSEADLAKVETLLDIPTISPCCTDFMHGTQKPILTLQNNNKVGELSHLLPCDKISCKKERDIKQTTDFQCSKPTHVKANEENNTFFSFEGKNLGESIKSEIELSEIKVGFQTELSRSDNKTPQLQIILERLTVANDDHKTGIINLRNPIIALQKVDSRILKKVNKYGFIKISSDFLKPLLPQRPKKIYPKGHYFARKQNVTFDESDFDKKFFHNALRRGAHIDDKGKFLKYQCPTCPYKTWSFNALSKHHSGLHGFKLNWTITCPDCKFTAKRESDMKRHQQRHKKEPDLRCPYCPYISRFDVGLRTHLRRWHLPDEEAKTLRCTYCNFVSICKTTYDAHLMVHIRRGKKFLSRFVHNSAKTTEVEVLKCEYCKFRTPDNNGLRRHMQETHKINSCKKELYRCKICGLEAKHRFSFRDHMLIHKKVEDKSLLQCNDCGFKTKWRKYLVVHMRTDHPRPEQQKETVYYHCAECDKKFPKKFSLKLHIFKQHKESETLMCHDCNYTTKSMAVLRRHTLSRHINLKKKIHKCQNCSHISEDKKKHKAHLLTHKLACYICGYETLAKNVLRYHIIGHMSKKKQQQVAKIHKCQCCDYRTRNKHHYERHMKRWSHHPVKAVENIGEVDHSEKDKPILDTKVQVHPSQDDNVHTLDQSLESKIEVDPFDTLLETKSKVPSHDNKEICDELVDHLELPLKNEVLDEVKRPDLL